MTWARWSSPIDRLVAADLRARNAAEPALVSDAIFARRAYLDVWGLLPTPAQLQAFAADTDPASAPRSSARCSPTTTSYAEHWISFWNDLLRNEEGVSYFSETAGRKSITDWLLAVAEDEPALRPVRHEAAESDAAGRSRGVPDRRQLARRNERQP